MLQEIYSTQLQHARQIGELQARIAASDARLTALESKPKAPKLTFEQWLRLLFTLAVLLAALSKNITVREAIGLIK